jgi:hypothetical protein
MSSLLAVTCGKHRVSVPLVGIDAACKTVWSKNSRVLRARDLSPCCFPCQLPFSDRYLDLESHFDF